MIWDFQYVLFRRYPAPTRTDVKPFLFDIDGNVRLLCNDMALPTCNGCAIQNAIFRAALANLRLKVILSYQSPRTSRVPDLGRVNWSPPDDAPLSPRKSNPPTCPHNHQKKFCTKEKTGDTSPRRATSFNHPKGKVMFQRV